MLSGKKCREKPKIKIVEMSLARKIRGSGTRPTGSSVRLRAKGSGDGVNVLTAQLCGHVMTFWSCSCGHNFSHGKKVPTSRAKKPQTSWIFADSGDCLFVFAFEESSGLAEVLRSPVKNSLVVLIKILSVAHKGAFNT